MSNPKQSFKIFNIRYEYYEELEETLLKVFDLWHSK